MTEKTATQDRLSHELRINKELAKLGNALIASTLPIASVATLVLESALLLTKSDHGYVSEIDPVTHENVCHSLTNMLGAHFSGKYTPAEKTAFPRGEDGRYPKLWGYTINSGEPLASNALSKHPLFSGLPQGHIAIERFLSIPVKYQQKVVGQISLANSTQDYSERDINAIQRLADIYALALNRHRTENEKIRLLEQAYKTSHLVALGELAAGVGHEINNPVGGVINYAEILKTKVANKEHEKFLDKIIHEGERIANIVKNLLFFANNDTTKPQEHGIEELISDALALMRTQLKHDRIEVNCSIAPDLGTLRCNAHQIEQVLINLFINSRHALNAKFAAGVGGKTIDIQAQKVSRGDTDFVKIDVRDNGIGIPEEMLAKVFNPFFRGEKRDTGAGLGLSICFDFVNAHDGNLSIESRPGEHTTVILELPLA